MACYTSGWKRRNKERIKFLQYRLQRLADEECPEGYCLKVKLRDIKGGRANNGWISIPLWVMAFPPGYATWYLLHEVSHYYTWGDSHGPKFRAKEEELCAKHGLQIIRSRAYPKALLRDGKVIYTRKWRKEFWRKVNARGGKIG